MDKKNDMFANIASMNQNFAERGMERPPVLETPDIILEMKKNDDYAKYCIKKMDTKDELYDEVKRQRAYYEPFMKNLAPEIKQTRKSIEINEFLFRHEEDTEWVKLKIPHYDGPVGKYTTFYRAEFYADADMMNFQTKYICFKGADYIAHVFINDIYAGSHEGFFAPFEFDITKMIKAGKNKLEIRLENDISMLDGGDKIYAATGPGFDEPVVGWHHCPAAMGLFQKVYLEGRNDIFLQNLFVQPGSDYKSMVLWTEVVSADKEEKDIAFDISVYGQNFLHTEFEHMLVKPSTSREIGVGDSLGEAMARKDKLLGVPVVLRLSRGVNYFKIPFEIKDARKWELQTPYLYQVQLQAISEGCVKDVQKTAFGVRTFKMDTENVPKGKIFFNGRKIKLRGTNTMGHEQQDVMKGDFEQLITDILIAKIANMNFFRLTQRPVQEEIYTYCDMLGIMTQTDFPLFGKIRINKVCECLRQVEEMEKFVRNHPCNVMISYINEPFPNASNAPHRCIPRKQMMDFFDCADKIVYWNNPDRVIKHVDGDYDPPSRTLPDNHCYTMWYNGNGIDIGALNKGEWMPIKKDWCFGCGEFGVEGIDTPEVMRKYYPASWIQTEGREAEWTPREVVKSQTGNFHYFFFEKPHSMEEWSKASRAYQAQAVEWQTECFRRNPLMVSFAIHLFIDAFPSNWMKTILDYERSPKPAYFTYRNALKPVMVSIRSDYKKVFGGRSYKVQPFICNDTDEELKNYKLCYQIDETKVSGSTIVSVPACDVLNTGNLILDIPKVTERTIVHVRVVLLDPDGNTVDWKTSELEIFPEVMMDMKKVTAYGAAAETLVKDMGCETAEKSDVIIISDYKLYELNKNKIDMLLNQGAKVIFMRLPNGKYEIAGNKVEMKFSSMLPLHLVSRDTGHPYVSDFRKNDFHYWYSKENDRILPLLYDSFTDDSFDPILTTGNANENKEWADALAAGEKRVGKGSLILCQVDLAGRVLDNPIAAMFVKKLFS